MNPSAWNSTFLSLSPTPTFSDTLMPYPSMVLAYSWHSTDAYHNQEKDFFRALFSNWFEKGADGVVVFNTSTTGDKNISLLKTVKNEIF